MNDLPYSRQSIDEDDIRAVVEALRSDYLTQGPRVLEFERALAAYCDTAYAVAFSSGTAALHGAYYAGGIGPDNEILTSPITFAATANAALYLGGSVRFSDVEPASGNMAPGLIEAALTSRTRAIVPVHYAGNPVDMDAVGAIARSRGLIVIEDACHALGATYRGRRIGGGSSAMTVFSFHPVKAITTCEGGAVMTGSEDVYERLLSFRSHGITRDPRRMSGESHGPWYYEMTELGYNYRMSDVQAALGRSQLGKLEAFTSKRQGLAGFYDDRFRGNPYFDTPTVTEGGTSAYHLYPIRLKGGLKGRRKEVFERLRRDGLWVQVHYIPVHMHPYYRGLGFKAGDYPVAEDFYGTEISIPLHQGMGDADALRVVDTVLAACEAISKTR